MYLNLYEHDGEENFPHGAGPSEDGLYGYKTADCSDQPDGPFSINVLYDAFGRDISSHLDLNILALFTITEAKKINDPALMRTMCREAIQQIMWYIRSTKDGFPFDVPSYVDTDLILANQIASISNFVSEL